MPNRPTAIGATTPPPDDFRNRLYRNLLDATGQEAEIQTKLRELGDRAAKGDVDALKEATELLDLWLGG